MGTLANILFQTLMGWIRTLSLDVWSTISSPEGTTFLGWIGAHWKGLVADALLFSLSVAVGLTPEMIDLAVYLMRWQPIRVWRSFFRRRKLPKEEYPEDEEDFREESDFEFTSTGIAQEPEPVLQEEYAFPGAGRIGTEWQATEEREESAWERYEPEGTTAAFEQAIRPRRRRVTRMLSDTQEDTLPPEELIDRYAAYRRPVYPRSWKADEGDDETDDSRD